MKWLLTLSFAVLAGTYHAMVQDADSFEVRVGEEIMKEAETNQRYEASSPVLTPTEAQKILYGKYEIPPTFSKVLLASKQWEKEGMDPASILGFYPITADMRYFNTPVDVIPFGSTGMDGIHYGFLTDFGSITDLEQAPVVCVSPMDFDQPTQLIARNFRDFLAVNRKDSPLFYNHFEDEQSYELKKQEWAREQEAFEKEYPPDLQIERAHQTARNALYEQLSLPDIPNSFTYIEEIRAERKQHTAIPTKDRLGVMDRSLPSAEQKKESGWSGDADRLGEYLQTASYGEKLAVFRDMTLCSDALLDPELRQLLINELQATGLADEAERLTFLD